MGLLPIRAAAGGATSGSSAAVSAEGLARLRRDGFSLDAPNQGAPLFHAGSSTSWPGLGELGGLVPSYGKVPAGEGLFSPIRRHSDICFGRGAEGYGTSRAYFESFNTSPRFAIRNYSDTALERELSIFEGVALGGRRSHVGLRVAQNYRPDQFASRIGFLREEQARRLNDSSPHYAVMFVLHLDRMENPPHLGGRFCAKLPGEVWIQQKLPLEVMSYFAAPAEHLDDARAQLEAIVPGAADRMLPIESFDAFAAGRKDVARARSKVRKVNRNLERGDWLRVNARLPAF